MIRRLIAWFRYRRAIMRARRDLDAIQRNFRVRMPKAWRLPPQ